MAVMKSLRANAACDTLSGAWDVRDLHLNDSKKHGTAKENGNDTLLCSFGGKDDSPPLAEFFGIRDRSE